MSTETNKLSAKNDDTWIWLKPLSAHEMWTHDCCCASPVRAERSYSRPDTKTPPDENEKDEEEGSPLTVVPARSEVRSEEVVGTVPHSSPSGTPRSSPVPLLRSGCGCPDANKLRPICYASKREFEKPAVAKRRNVRDRQRHRRTITHKTCPRT